MLRLTKINNYSEFGSDLVGGVGPNVQLIESDSIKTAISTIVALIAGSINPALLSFQFVLPLAMSYFGPTKRVYTSEDIKEMFNSVKEAYQAPYIAYSLNKEITPSVMDVLPVIPNTSEDIATAIPNVIQQSLPNIDYSKYDINKNVWRLSGYYGWDRLGYNKSRYTMYGGFGIKMIQKHI